MQIIIVGCGKVGSTLVQELSMEGHDISIIDINDEVVEEISNNYDTMGIVGNGASHAVLSEAGIEKADILIAVTDSDELNLLCCLIARKTSNCRTIARVRNPVYSEEAEFIKQNLGLCMVINPEYEAACEIERLLKFPSAIGINVFNRGKVEIMTFKVKKGCILDGMQVKNVHKDLKCDVLVATIERNDKVIIPNGELTIVENDIISIIAPHKKGIEFFEKIGMIINPVKNAMIIGGGRLSYYLSKKLICSGINVKIIEKKLSRCEELTELLPKAMVINGDGTDQDLLKEIGISKAESFASLTGIDEENVLLSLYARSKMNGKLITKVNRVRFDEVIDSLDLGSIISPKYITSKYILRYVRAMNNSLGSNIETLYKIRKDQAEALEFCVKESSKLIGIPLEKLQLKDNILICSINRNGEIITPKGQDCIEAKDRVIVVATNSRFDDLDDILRR